MTDCDVLIDAASAAPDDPDASGDSARPREAARQREPLIRLRRVAKDYRKGRLTVPVLRQVDLDIGRGDFVALMGSSGSGKTTLLNLMGSLDRPSAGAIDVAGQAIHALGAGPLSRWRARHIGFIFQFYNLLPSLTAAQNVEVPLLILGLPRRERRQRVERVLDLVDLLDRREHRPGELSGGQQQRVAIARALIADPPILLCDEPTGDLDRETGMVIMEVLRSLNARQGKTIVVATHDTDVAAFARRLVRFERHTVREEARA